MELKKIIFYLGFISFLSCTPLEPADIISEYIIVNKSGVGINMVLYRIKNDTIEIVNNEEYKSEGDLTHPLYCDSLGIIFNHNKKVIYKWSDSNQSLRNPLKIDSYKGTKMNEDHYLFRYTFTEEDYKSISN